jgi:hypothetical protein
MLTTQLNELVQARWAHKRGERLWLSGRVSEVHENGTYSIVCEMDQKKEKFVKRQVKILQALSFN